MDSKKTNERSNTNNGEKSKKSIFVIVFLVTVIVILVVAVSDKNKTAKNDSKNQNNANEQVKTEIQQDCDDFNIENNDVLTQDEEQNIENDGTIEENESQAMSFEEIRALEKDSQDFDSNLVIKAHELAQEKYRDKTLSLIYTNGEDSKVTVNGKECYQITITEENEDPEKEAEIIGYMAISLEDEKVYYRDVNGNY